MDDGLCAPKAHPRQPKTKLVKGGLAPWSNSFEAEMMMFTRALHCSELHPIIAEKASRMVDYG